MALRRSRKPSDGDDPRALGGSMVNVGGSHDRAGVVIDMRNCVLIDSIEVCVVDRWSDDEDGDAMYMVLNGRINKTTDRTRIGYLMNTDGAAAIVSEFLALFDRCGPEFLGDLVARLITLHKDDHVAIGNLKVAVDLAHDALGGRD